MKTRKNKNYNVKACLHQPGDKYFLANSYDLKRKPIAPDRRQIAVSRHN